MILLFRGVLVDDRVVDRKVPIVILMTTAKKWTKVKNARAERAKLLFLPEKNANL